MDNAKQQIVEKLQNANNILVTVSANPSVDQLAACIGLTLLLNKLNKHATAVFSGKVPSTIEFLKPEKTLETNTDSLRDFIIALDKAKADKLRYKVEDEVVKIFITPYKSSITDKDLIFSQGDFNVDVVMALGVHQAQDLDNAITAHGRILHDAVVICVNTTPNGGLGTINWEATTASSISEMVTGLATGLSQTVLDGQIATALLTGIVAETAHFSNQKTSPETMTTSATLLAAGANQQLVSTELAQKDEPPKLPAPADPTPVPEPPKQTADGELDVPHVPDEPKKPTPKTEELEADDDSEATDAQSADQDAGLAKLPAVTGTDKPADESVEKPANEPKSDEKAAEPVKTSAAKPAAKSKEKAPHMKRIEPLPHESEKAAEEAQPSTPEAHSLESLLHQADSDLADHIAASELPTPNPTPGAAPIVEVPPAPPEAKPAEPAPLQIIEPDTASQPSAAPVVSPTPPVSAPAPEVVVAPTPAPASQPIPAPAPVVEPQSPAEAASVTGPAPDNVTPPTTQPVNGADAAVTDVDSARRAVEDALKGALDPMPEPLERAGAVAVDLDLGHDAQAPAVPPAAPTVQPGPGVAPSPAGLPDYLQTPSTTAAMPPFEDLASTPAPVGLKVPPPQVTPPTATNLSPQGPPPPAPPPMTGL